MEKIYVSKLEGKHFLGVDTQFQSLSQFFSYVVVVVLGVLIVFLAIFVLFSSDFSYAIILGASVGALFPVYMAKPARLIVRCSREETDFWIRIIHERLDFMGYILYEKEGNASYRRTYRSKLPRCLRWKENDISIYRSENENGYLVAQGPQVILNFLAKKLKNNA